MKNKQLKKQTLQKQPATKFSKPIQTTKRSSSYDYLSIALIIILGVIIYSNSFRCSFQFDDKASIVENASIRNISDFKTIWNYSTSRPMAYITFALNYHFGNLDVKGYHLINLMIHLFTSCIVWWITLLIFSSPALKEKGMSKHKKAIALFTALLFVSHPLATQSVTYIVQRMASMVAMFYLLSLALYIKGRLGSGNMKKYIWFAGALISAILAFLTKENAFTLPFAIILVEIFFLQTKKFKVELKDYRIWVIILAFFSLSAIVLSKYSLHILDPILPYNGNTYIINANNYLFTQFSVIIKYVQLLFLPIYQNADYDFHISNSFFELRTFFSFLVLLALFIFGIFLFKKNRIISFGIFWFFLTLAVESSFIPIYDVIFEHRTYLPSFGFFLILSSSIYMLLWEKYKYYAVTIFSLIIITNSILTFQRNKVWENPGTLWTDVESKSPNKIRAYSSLGNFYIDSREWDNAISQYSKAISINPNYEISFANRGIAYDNLGKFELAIEDYNRVLHINSSNASVYANRGIVYDKLGQWDKAIADYSKAIELKPNDAISYNNRGIVYGKQYKLDKAIIDFSKALEIDPNYRDAFNNREIAYSQLKQINNKPLLIK